jgi:ATP-dependent DNA ligase
MFGRREPVYVAFDVLFAEGEDVRALPLKDRKALLEKVVRCRSRSSPWEPSAIGAETIVIASQVVSQSALLVSG